MFLYINCQTERNEGLLRCHFQLRILKGKWATVTQSKTLALETFEVPWMTVLSFASLMRYSESMWGRSPFVLQHVCAWMDLLTFCSKTVSKNQEHLWAHLEQTEDRWLYPSWKEIQAADRERCFSFSCCFCNQPCDFRQVIDPEPHVNHL